MQVLLTGASGFIGAHVADEPAEPGRPGAGVLPPLAQLPLFFSSAKAREKLGYVSRSAAEALAAAATWFAERLARATTSSAASGSWAVLSGAGLGRKRPIECVGQ